MHAVPYSFEGDSTRREDTVSLSSFYLLRELMLPYFHTKSDDTKSLTGFAVDSDESVQPLDKILAIIKEPEPNKGSSISLACMVG